MKQEEKQVEKIQQVEEKKKRWGYRD